jgi:TFIIF-interacting CTD phosphatase-like protein
MTSNSTLNLVLDLDQTMIHSFVPESPKLWEQYVKLFQDEKNFLMMVRQASFICFVFMRPYLLEFLLHAQKFFTLYVYSAGTNEYVKTILKAILSKLPSVRIAGLWTKEHMVNEKKCIEKYIDVQKTYIIDDIPSFWRQKCFRIKPFISYIEKIHIDEKTNKRSLILEKQFKDDDTYLNDFLNKVIDIVNLEIKIF